MYDNLVEVICSFNNPCLCYAKVWNWFNNNKVSHQSWNDFSFACLEYLMEENKKNS